MESAGFCEMKPNFEAGRKEGRRQLAEELLKIIDEPLPKDITEDTPCAALDFIKFQFKKLTNNIEKETAKPKDRTWTEEDAKK